MQSYRSIKQILIKFYRCSKSISHSRPDYIVNVIELKTFQFKML